MPINEDEFLAALIPTLHQSEDVVVPPGDDCAAISIGDDHLLLLAVDQVVEDIHYFGAASTERVQAGLAGRKLVCRNISDIAAMGGTPKYALTAIGMPRDEDSARLQDFALGIKAAADSFDVSLIGGDLSSASSEFASLTIIGTVPRDQICLRSNATAGDCIVVTGAFGGSLASGRHLTFEPRIREGRWLAEHGITRCMIDASDGLVKDLSRLAQASRVSAEVDESAVPVHEGCGLNDALYGGEDYELIFSVSRDRVDTLLSSWPFECPLTNIGCFTESPEPAVISATRDGMVLDDEQMYSHFGS